MRVPDKFSFNKVFSIYEELRLERHEWDIYARLVSEWLLPGRGIFQTYVRPKRRKLTSPRVINAMAEDSLYVLTSGIHGRLTSPAMPWFRTTWPIDQLNQIPQLVSWLEQATNILQKSLHVSNFYSIINSFYIEYAGYGTGSIYVGEDTYDDQLPFRFELLTFGEYAMAMGADGLPSVYCRTVFMSPRQMFEKFGDNVSENIKRIVNNNEAGADYIDLAVIEFIAKHEFQDKSYIRLFYEVTATGVNSGIKSATKFNDKPLGQDAFYEFPYPTARWNTIGSDTYGIGPGNRAIPDIKRLQEMEKAFLMATHKSINPPLNAPSRMKGKLNTLPGGKNYYANPNETVNEVYQVRFDYAGVSSAIERVEQRIQRNFFNDVFITASRDPNASPLRTGQVDAMQQEQMFKVGPITERLHSELFTPMIRRCFKILFRKGMLPALDPQYEEFVDQMKIDIISPMAVAQSKARAQGVDAFMGFIGQAAQFDQQILDNINVDAAARNRAEIEGVELGILRTEDEVAQIRKQRAEAQAAQQKQEAEIAQAGMQSQLSTEEAQTMKTQAEAGQILGETQLTAVEGGLA